MLENAQVFLLKFVADFDICWLKWGSCIHFVRLCVHHWRAQVLLCWCLSGLSFVLDLNKGRISDLHFPKNWRTHLLMLWPFMIFLIEGFQISKNWTECIINTECISCMSDLYFVKYFFLTLFACLVLSVLNLLGLELTDNCEPPYGSWELNPGVLEEQSVLWTTEPSLLAPGLLFWKSEVDFDQVQFARFVLCFWWYFQNYFCVCVCYYGWNPGPVTN